MSVYPIIKSTKFLIKADRCLINTQAGIHVYESMVNPMDPSLKCARAASWMMGDVAVNSYLALISKS